MEEAYSVSRADDAACKHHVLMIFEDIEQQYLEGLVREHAFNSDAVVAIILDRQERGHPYPKRTNSLKRKRSDIADGEDEDTEHPRNGVQAQVDQPNYGGQMRSTEYKDLATILLSQDFPKVPKTTIKSKLLSRNGFSVFRTYIAMDAATRNWDEKNPMWLDKKTPTKTLTQYSAAAIQDLNRDDFTADQCAALDEFIASRKAKAKRDADIAAETAEQQNLERARKSGELGECGCCFDDFPLNRMVHCEGTNVHLFCRGCMRQQAETTIGYSKHELTCVSMDGCSAGFSVAQKGIFLDNKLRIALNRIEAQAALAAAGIENLETCPFCPMAMEYPPVEENKEFRCNNPSCEAVSCRLCRKLTHIPKTCAEAAAEESHSVRHTIEEAMSEAIIRKCNKCSNPYIKQEGCNKIHCSRCGTLQCYVCRQTVKDYSHFNDKNRGGKNGQCPLFDQTETRHQDEVRQAEEASRSQVVKDNPELNGEVLKVKVSARVQEDEQKRRDGEARPGGHGAFVPPIPPAFLRVAPENPIAGGPLRLNDAERPVEWRRLAHNDLQQRIREARQHHEQRFEGAIRQQVQQAAVNAGAARPNAPGGRLEALERLARFQNQQAQAHRNAARMVRVDLVQQLEAAPIRNIVAAERPDAQAEYNAQLMPSRRPRGPGAAMRIAANPIVPNPPPIAAGMRRDLRDDNVFIPLRIGQDLNILRQLGDPLQQLLNNGAGLQPNLALFQWGNMPNLEAIDRMNGPNGMLGPAPPARGGLGQVQRSAPLGEVRGRPAPRAHQRAAPANRLRNASA